MKKRRVSPIGVAFVALVLLVLLFVVRGALHRPARTGFYHIDPQFFQCFGDLDLFNTV